MIRHLPIPGHKTFIRIRPERYECPYCEGKPATTQKMTWYDQRSPDTDVYEKHVLPGLINSTVADVSIREDIGCEAVTVIINRHVESEVSRYEIRRSETIGIDGISLKKGHRDSVTLITGGEGRRITGVLQGREKATVKAFLSGIPERLEQTLKAVCCDMYDGYINAVKEVSGGKVMAEADRFHAAKLYPKDSDGLRNKYMLSLIYLRSSIFVLPYKSVCQEKADRVVSQLHIPKDTHRRHKNALPISKGNIEGAIRSCPIVTPMISDFSGSLRTTAKNVFVSAMIFISIELYVMLS